MLGAPDRGIIEFYSRNSTLGSTERYRCSTEAEKRYLSLQYEGLADWYDKSKPLRKRKPRILVPLYKEAIDTLDRFIWGGHRHPKAVVGATRKADEPERPGEIGPRLFPDQAALLSSFVAQMVRQGRLDRAIRESSRVARVTTSAAIIIGTRGGYISCHVEAGKHCTPTFDTKNPHRLSRLEILYQYEKEESNAFGGFKKRMYWYRRILDENTDTVFVEMPVHPGVQPEWQIDEEKTVEHKLGFCPAQWIRTCPDSTDPIDGRPVIDPALYPMLDAINYAISQRHRAVEYGCDPQWIRKGVPEAQREQLNKSPGSIWDLPADGALEAAELKLPGAAVATDHLRDLRERFLEACAVVLADPKAVNGHVSGVVLELLHAPMLALASDLRADLGDDGYGGLIGLALRLCATVSARGEDIWIPGIDDAARTVMGAQLRGVWLDPPIQLQWPSFFDLDVQDQNAKVDLTNKAVQGGLISKIAGTRNIAQIFGIEDPEAEHELIETEAKEMADYGPMLTRQDTQADPMASEAEAEAKAEEVSESEE